MSCWPFRKNIKQTWIWMRYERFQIQNGGMVATHGLVIAEMGDKNEDMVVVCVAVTVGY
jgi:uncharacterized protein (TIGR02058 family)